MTQNILSAPAKAHQSEKRNRFLDSFFHPFLTTLNASSEADCKCPLYSRFYDILRGFLCKRQMSSIPYKSSIPATFQSLLLINHLEDIEFQIIGLICCPQDRVIRGLGAEFDLTETLMRGSGCLAHGLRQKLLRRKM